MQVGRGLVLALDLDALGFEYLDPLWRHRVVAGRSLRRDPGLDASIVGFDTGQARNDFYLAESRLNHADGNQYYLFGLATVDRTRSLDRAQAVLDFEYRSHYLGAGGEGRLSKQLLFYSEAVMEDGSTLADRPALRRVTVKSHALVAGLQYFPRGDWTPQLSLELAHGSGDAERLSVTDTFGGGNQSATTDKNFLYHGSYDGGLALSPRLSNLTVTRLGYQVKPRPLPQELLPELLLGVVGSRYWKDHAAGGISDTVATETSTDVGKAVDVFVAAKPLADLAFFAQYGRFVPGDAYPADSRDASNRVLVTATQSF